MEYLKRFLLGGYDELWKAILRPPRDIYDVKDLGQDRFIINDSYYKRKDFFIFNRFGLKIMCSHWEPIYEERIKEKMPCVIYLHGNCSSRTEVTCEVKNLLKLGCTVFSFDFTGCGLSDGNWVTLGYKEKFDIESVIEYLIKTNRVDKIALWGRSMGSVSAILYCEIMEKFNQSINCLILDSPFSLLKLLIKEIASDYSIIPKFVVDKFLNIIDEKLQEKANFTIDSINCLESMKNLKIPCMFLSGKNDNFVKPHHSNLLYDEYLGSKQFLIFDGDHNSIRPSHIKDSIYQFLEINLGLKESFTFNKKIIMDSYNREKKKKCNIDIKKKDFKNRSKISELIIEEDDLSDEFRKVYDSLTSRNKKKNLLKSRETLLESISSNISNEKPVKNIKTMISGKNQFLNNKNSNLSYINNTEVNRVDNKSNKELYRSNNIINKEKKDSSNHIKNLQLKKTYKSVSDLNKQKLINDNLNINEFKKESTNKLKINKLIQCKPKSIVDEHIVDNFNNTSDTKSC